MATTISELGRMAGVSASTVSRVLSGKARGRVSERRRREILSLAEKYDYGANRAARGLAKGRAYRIAICFRDFLMSFPPEASASLCCEMGLFSRRIQEAGYAAEIIQVDAHQPTEATTRELRRKGVDGFIFLEWESRLAERVLFSLKERGIPAVAMGATLSDEFTWTDVDRQDAYEQATRYLVGEGHRRIALLDFSTMALYSAPKRRGFVDTMAKELGVDAGRWIFKARTKSIPGVIHATEEALDRVEKLSALLLSGSEYSDAVTYVLRHRGIEPGRDCRIIGFGNTTLAERSSVPLSHLGKGSGDQVAFGLEALLEQIERAAEYEPRHKLFRSRLILRET